jgi:hypothetical protein
MLIFLSLLITLNYMKSVSFWASAFVGAFSHDEPTRFESINKIVLGVASNLKFGDTEYSIRIISTLVGVITKWRYGALGLGFLFLVATKIANSVFEHLVFRIVARTKYFAIYLLEFIGNTVSGLCV